MILVLKTSHHEPSDAKHNPSQLLRLLSKESSAISDVQALPQKNIIDKIARLLASFQDLEHEGEDTRSQCGIKIQGYRFKDLKSQDKVKAKDKDIKIKLRDIKSKIHIQDHKHAKGTSKEFPRTQGSMI
ncbi:hypothetical protein Tco_0001058 [Tanacetum coccineum]